MASAEDAVGSISGDGGAQAGDQTDTGLAKGAM